MQASASDGVIITGCHPGDCHYLKGNYYARRKFALLKEIFKELGLQEERLRLSWISASEGPRFAEVITEFTKDVKELGPNAAGKEIFI